MIDFLENHFVFLIYLIYAVVALLGYKKLMEKKDYKKGLRTIMLINMFLFLISFLSFQVIVNTRPEFDYSFFPLIGISILTLLVLLTFQMIAIKYERFRSANVIYVLAIMPILVVLLGMFLWEFYIFHRI